MKAAPYRERMKRREIPGGVRFITFSCQHREKLLTNPRICELFVRAMGTARSRLGLEVFAWVLMPEHVHLMCRAAAGTTVERALRSVKMGVATRVLARWQGVNAAILADLRDATGRARFWQKGGGFDRNVRDDSELAREVRYIHRNPVERELVARPEDWTWSSVRWWMGMREGEFACDPPPGRPGQWDGWQGFI